MLKVLAKKGLLRGRTIGIDATTLEANAALRSIVRRDDGTNYPDAKIMKMNDGRTHLAHKAEHSVDMDSSAVLAVTVQDATHGDPTTMKQTIVATVENVNAVVAVESVESRLVMART